MIQRSPRPIVRFLAVALAVLAGAGLSEGKDTWTEPFDGVRLLHRSTDDPKWDFHLAVIDLTEPGVRLNATPPEDRKSTVSGFAKRKKVQLAVNGDFFSYKDYSTGGLAIGEGKVWPDSHDSKSRGVLAGGPGKVVLFDQKEVVKPEPWMQFAVSGHGQLVDDGAPCESKDAVLGPRHPRTAVGIAKDGKTLMILVVDGRQKQSVGMTGKEMQKVFVEFGAWRALNFDGGGSSTMYVEGPGVVNKPSEHRERTVGNHLGVFAAAGKAQPKGLVRGTVTDKATGKPLTGARVTLTSSYFDETSAKGFYELSEVPEGQAQLTVTLDGYETARPRVKVEAKQAADLDVALEPKPAPPGKTTLSEPPPAKPETPKPEPTASGGEAADRLLEKGRNYEKSRLLGNALDAYREVVKQFPGTAQAEIADERSQAVEAELGESPGQ